MKYLALTLSLHDKPNCCRRKRHFVNVDNSRNGVSRTIRMNSRHSNNNLLDFSRRTKVGSHVRDMD
jgi:hypothetical protein